MSSEVSRKMKQTKQKSKWHRNIQCRSIVPRLIEIDYVVCVQLLTDRLAVITKVTGAFGYAAKDEVDDEIKEIRSS